MADQTGADPETGTVAFDYGGSQYEMVFDMKAVAFFEREADMSIVTAFEQLEAAAKAGEAAKVSLVGFLMQAGLRRHHPEVDGDRALRMLSDPAVQQALGVAVKAAAPDPQAAPTTKAKAPGRKRSTSPSSSSKRSKPD